MSINYKVFLPFIIVLLLSLFFFSFSKGDVVLAINKIHTPVLDTFFVCLTNIGDAITVFLFLAIALKFKLKFVVVFVLAFLIESLIVILCKNLIFYDFTRPYVLFKNKGILSQINFVDGVNVHTIHSFPSGHTAYAFVMATFFALKINKIIPAIGLCLFAVLVGVSRMYLVQHFFMDVFAGAIVGTSSAYLAIVLVKNSRNRKWYNKSICFMPTQKK